MAARVAIENRGPKKSSNSKVHPKPSQGFREQIGPFRHKIKGLSKNSHQKYHPKFAESLGRRILGSTFSGPKKKNCLTPSSTSPILPGAEVGSTESFPQQFTHGVVSEGFLRKFCGNFAEISRKIRFIASGKGAEILRKVRGGELLIPEDVRSFPLKAGPRKPQESFDRGPPTIYRHHKRLWNTGLLSRRFWEGLSFPNFVESASRSCPSPSSALCPFLYRTEREKVPGKGEEEGWPAKGQKGKRTRENWSGIKKGFQRGWCTNCQNLREQQNVYHPQDCTGDVHHGFFWGGGGWCADCGVRFLRPFF